MTYLGTVSHSCRFHVTAHHLVQKPTAGSNRANVRNPKHSCNITPGRLVQRNRANVELLNLVDGTDGQSAVVGQSQTVTQGE